MMMIIILELNARALLVLALTLQRHLRELRAPREPDAEHHAEFLERHAPSRAAPAPPSRLCRPRALRRPQFGL